jgi:hypothetical protein
MARGVKGRRYNLTGRGPNSSGRPETCVEAPSIAAVAEQHVIAAVAVERVVTFCASECTFQRILGMLAWTLSPPRKRAQPMTTALSFFLGLCPDPLARGLGGVGWGPDAESISAAPVRFRIQLTLLVGRAMEPNPKGKQPSAVLGSQGGCGCSHRTGRSSCPASYSRWAPATGIGLARDRQQQGDDGDGVCFMLASIAWKNVVTKVPSR